MNPLSIICVVALLLAGANGHGIKNSVSNKMRPSEWLSLSELEQIPSLEEITLEGLENMPLEKGAKLMETVYHLSQINHELKPNFVPNSANIPCYIVKANGEKVTTTLDKLASTCMQLPNFGSEEVTIFITGLPDTIESVRKANRELIESYLQRYNVKREQPRRYSFAGEEMKSDSDEYMADDWKRPEHSTGSLVIIDLGSKLNSFKRFTTLDAEQAGTMIGYSIVGLTEKCGVVHETIHIVGQGPGAHVAGEAAVEYARRTGRKLGRVTGLAPTKIFARNPKSLTGLSCGDAKVVDAIYTNTYGMGIARPVACMNFYPNGPYSNMPGVDNIIEDNMRATRYFAETVRPGNERNFPAVAANSLKDYKNNDGYGRRVYMGIDTDYDVQGNFILEVNPKSPFGNRARAQKQNYYHGVHNLWKKLQDNE